MTAKDSTEWEETTEEEFVPYNIPSEYQFLPREEIQLSVRELWSRYLSKELILDPDFQRHYVWDRQRASRFIESLLLDLPVPPIFLAENPDGRLDVIDGHQRLQSIFRFLQPVLGGPSEGRRPPVVFSPLTLSSCEVLSELNGKGVTALDINKRGKLWEHKQTVILIKKDAHPKMKFELFARLNQGAMALYPQELRNCLYRGPYNNLIARIAESPDVLKAFGRREPEKRMSDRERVLRFFALAHRRDKYFTPFRSFLNEEMGANQLASPEQLSAYRVEFESALNWVTRIFSDEKFYMFRLGSVENPNGRWVRRRLDLLYELEMVGFHEVAESLETIWSHFQPQERQAFVFGLRHRLIDVMGMDSFLRTFSAQTTAPHIIRERFDYWLGQLRQSIESWQKTVEEADKIISLQRMSTACRLCSSHIGSSDDASLVMVGNKEGLAHRFCKRNQVAKPF